MLTPRQRRALRHRSRSLPATAAVAVLLGTCAGLVVAWADRGADLAHDEAPAPDPGADQVASETGGRDGVSSLAAADERLVAVALPPAAPPLAPGDLVDLLDGGRGSATAASYGSPWWDGSDEPPWVARSARVVALEGQVATVAVAEAEAAAVAAVASRSQIGLALHPAR